MGFDQVETKEKEIIEALAKETGVSVKDVEKILTRLGLKGALKNRLVREKKPKGLFGLRKIKPVKLSELNLSFIRISAANDMMQ